MLQPALGAGLGGAALMGSRGVSGPEFRLSLSWLSVTSLSLS